MKLSESWLREWVNPPIDTKTLCQQFTMAGLEIDSVEEVAGETLIEVDLTPNRGDCLSVYGLAREAAVLNRLSIKPLEMQSIPAQVNATFSIEIEAPHDCPRYVGRVIQNIRQADTPSWMIKRLEQSGIRSIHPVVDILNYVMLELGQPMHAFDLQKLKSAIVVRHAKPNETLILLDGQEITLNNKTLVIADKQHALALAGIMGGQDSGVSERTKDIFLESALFSSHLIAGKARQYSLHTDSSFRFERGVDPSLQILAIERATALICEICGGEAGPVLDHKNDKMLPKPLAMTLRHERIQKLLGYDIPEQEVVSILRLLGCQVSALQHEAKSWQVVPPSFRYDITAEIDLIEELVRIVGYDNVPSRLPHAQIDFVSRQKHFSFDRIKRILVDLGYQEVITYSFVDEVLQKQLFPEAEMLTLLNPISADMGTMRLSLWPGLLSIAKYNQHRQQTRQKLFEIGMRFLPTENGLIQEEMVSALICGEHFSENWTNPKGNFDFYDIKQPIETFWHLMGNQKPLSFKAMTTLAACHPGQTAEISFEGKSLGIVGRLHPQLEKQLDIAGPLFLFELSMTFFDNVQLTQFEAPSKFPEIRRDIALNVEKALVGETLTDFVRKTAGDILRDVKIFDVYTGKGIAEGRKSIALGLIFQHPSRTLIDSEVDDLVHSLVAGLKKEFHADLRD